MATYKNTYKKWWKGMTDNDFLTFDGEVLYGENVDFTRDGYGVTLGPKSEQLTQLLNGDIVTSLIFENSTTDNDYIITTYAGRILYFNNDVLETNYDTGERIAAAIKVGDWIYFHNDDGLELKRIEVNDITNNTIVPTDIEDVLEVGNLDDTDPNPFFLDGDSLYYIQKTSIVKLSGVRNLAVPAKNTVDPAYDPDVYVGYETFNFPDIYGINKVSSTIRLYQRDGRMLEWDGAATTTKGSVPNTIADGKVYNTNVNTYIADFMGNLFQQEGYNFKSLSKAKTTNYLNTPGEEYLKMNNIYHNFMTTDGKGDVYIASRDTVPGIYKIGEVREGLGKGISKIVTTSSSGNIDFIYGVWASRDRLFYQYSDGVSSYIDKVELDGDRADSGFFISPILNGDNTEDKEVVEITGVARNVGDTDEINLSARIDESTFTSIGQRTGADFKKKFRLNAPDDINLDKFNDLQFKVEIVNNENNDIAINAFKSTFNIVNE